MAMTVQQIFDQVDLRYPNSVSDANKATMLNNIQKELFRTIYKKKTFTSYDIIEGLAYYPLDFDIAKVLNVLVDGKEYDWEDNNDREAQDPYAYAYENSVVVVPTPSEDIESGLLIWHFEEPSPIASVGQVPQFDGDFHMILVYLLCKDLSEIGGKDDRAEYFQMKANSKIKEFEGTNPEPELSPIGVS